MTTTDTDIATDLEQWEAIVDTLAQAVDERDFRLFRRTMAGSHQLYERLQRRLQNEQPDSSTRSCLVAATERWQSLSHAIAEWQQSVKDEMTTTKRRQQNDRKIASVYNAAPNRSGRSVRIRVR